MTKTTRDMNQNKISDDEKFLILGTKEETLDFEQEDIACLLPFEKKPLLLLLLLLLSDILAESAPEKPL